MQRTFSRGLWLVTALFCTLTVLAQNEDDALRYSWLRPGGTARSWGLGGAMGAVGADPGSASLNPGGFALYNTTELSITPGLENNTAEDLYAGTVSSGTYTRAFINNFSLVLCYPGKAESDFKSTVFGLSFDREGSYYWERPTVGNAVNTTLLQNFVNEANGTRPADLFNTYSFTSGLAYDTYAIDPLDTVANTYSSQIPYGSEVRQAHTITSTGRSQTTSIFFATNYMDKLYMGASLGLVGVRYSSTTTHAETTLVDTLDLQDFTYREELATTGSGIDLKVGLVGRVNERLRLGLAYHSPKWLQLDDVYYTRMATNFRTPDSDGKYGYTADSPDGAFRYHVNTPGSVLVSAAYIAGKNGLVSVDYGYTDYRKMRLKRDTGIPDSYDFSAENAAISRSFSSAQTVRVGTEWRTGNLYYRGGWSWSQDPYAETDPRHGTGYKRYCLGIGHRNTHLSLDLALTYGQGTTSFYQYDPALVSATQETRTDYSALVTVALRP